MRRSKSDPSKYARNYRSISQRRMTQYNDDKADSEEKEMERLRSILRNSELQVAQSKQATQQESMMKEEQEEDKKKCKSSKKRRIGDGDNDESKKATATSSTTSHDVVVEADGGDNDDECFYSSTTTENPLIIIPSSKKKKQKKKEDKQTILTPYEMKQAKLLQKNTTRKLQQLEQRATQKRKRTELYKQLEEQQTQQLLNVPNGRDFSTSLLPLLSSSSTLSRKKKQSSNNKRLHPSISKKQMLQRLLQKERAGIALSNEELELLYPSKEINEEEYEDVDVDDNNVVNDGDDDSNKNRKHIKYDKNNSISNPTTKNDGSNHKEKEEEEEEKKHNNKKKKKKKNHTKNQDLRQDEIDCEKNDDDAMDVETKRDISKTRTEQTKYRKEDGDDDNIVSPPPTTTTTTTTATIDDNNSKSSMVGTTSTTTGFAAMMMASLSKLKQETVEKKQQQEDDVEGKDEMEDVVDSKKKRYVPTNPTVLKTAATIMGNATTTNNDDSQQQSRNNTNKVVMHINRPKDIEQSRYDLPVSAMEFEIVDAIRNNDVTIICGETGSGKSTQVCQFLYEAGFSQRPSTTTKVNGNDDDDKEVNEKKPLLIGITQPRRVAAVSTAKRVCYEMGHGDGQSIRNSKNTGSNRGGGTGNLVAYKTRYESAGIGKNTNLLFATDGILLQEIQDDLLLRKYSVIILDETHERNLNTDVLIGLLSLALPLRKKAAEEDESLVPLKLVLMSATLRVEDFTKNTKLFPSCTPAVIRVPGRTFPVTIHHSKVTELDDYESAAYRKVCKMHRKLPNGGILVFLTGKQEIVRMVNRLRKSLNPSNKSRRNNFVQDQFTGSDDVVQNEDDNAPREIDDEEIDGDEDDDFDLEHDIDEDVVDDELNKNDESEDTTEDNRPSNAYVLPLYSMLSAEEQAKVFAPVPENHRLIVVCTNIAETSITIPGISYVVDTGRQKCRNYNSGTGVVSYDIMWISKAAADQRAGRAGRTGPGHCYRLYSSSLYSRHMDKFAVPEVMIRPLEDVVLAMKALKVSDAARFPFPTPPNKGQIKAAVKLLANIGCLDISNVERDGGDGRITKLGEAIAKLPLGVRYGKMLLVSAQAGVLDYAITMVAVLSEVSPFLHGGQRTNEDVDKDKEGSGDEDSDSSESDDDAKEKQKRQKEAHQRWKHRGGDILAAMLAVGAYTYAGRGAGGTSEQVACRKFCEENRLNYVVMTRVQKLRSHLARLAKIRLRSVDSVASRTGGFLSSMKPPNRLQENLLMQAIASGLLDNIALLAPHGSITGKRSFNLRSSYLSCSLSSEEPLLMDQTSVVYSRDFRQLPQWVCYDSVVNKTAKDGTSLSVMKKITPIDPSWIGSLAQGSRLLSLGAPLPVPSPHYDEEKDAVMCSVVTKFGSHGWELPPVKRELFDTLRSPEFKYKSGQFTADDSFRWFARFLLEGKVISELRGLKEMLNDSPGIITRRSPLAKVGLLVMELSRAGVDCATALRKHWAGSDNKFLFKCIKSWIKSEYHSEAKQLWIAAVKKNVRMVSKEPSL